MKLSTSGPKTALPKEYDVSTSFTDAKIANQKLEPNDVYHKVNLRELPDLLELKRQVDSEIAKMTWWESYGIDSLVHAFGVIGAVASFFIMKSDSTLACAAGVALLGCCHSILSVKGGHLAAHRAAVQSAPLNRLLAFFFSDVCGSFPSDIGYVLHVKEHHPYTNIVGLGDSSTWKQPFVPAYLYMFVTPLFLPIVTPFISIGLLWGQWLLMVRYTLLAGLGYFANLYLFVHVSGFSLLQAVGMTLASRAVLSIPYIHVNIFQHIGLPMFTLKDKPKKIYQMSTGVLNLSRNPVLDYCFGHSIISAHVEHHLFPRLSDQQCLRVKPLVQTFLLSRGLAYNQASYGDRLAVFLSKYRQLMVLAPPLSHFVGIQ